MSSLPPGFSIRRVAPRDYHRVKDILNGLSTVGEVTESQFKEVLSYWDELTLKINGSDTKVYNPMVIVDSSDCAVATGCVFLERKILHDCGLVGHIEDIAVAKDQRGKQLGLLLIQHLTHLALSQGCYKVILDCDESNVGFYKKCGYSVKGVEMDRRD